MLCLLLNNSLYSKAADTIESKSSDSVTKYLTKDEAKCFIGFIFNTNNLTDEQLNKNDMFKLMTGQLSGIEEEYAGVQFLEFMNIRLFSTIGKLESIVDSSSEFLIEYLTAKVNESNGLAGDIINSTISDISNQLLDYVLEESMIHGQGLENMEYEFFQDGMLDAKRIKELQGIPNKVEEYRKQILALSNAVFLAAGTNKSEMYRYFLLYKNNLETKYTIGEEAFQLIMDANKLYNEKLTVIMSIQPTLANWSFLDENMLLWATEDRIQLIEKWAEYTYQLEQRIKETSISLDNQDNTTAIHYNLIDEVYFDYILTGEGATITKYKGNYSYAKIPNSIAGYKVIAIDNNAFEESVWLRYLYIPASVKRIGKNAFLNCSGLTKVIIPNGNIEIGERAFGIYRKQTINGKDYVLDKGIGTTLCGASGSNVQNYAEASGNLFESTDWDGTSQEVSPVGNTYYINTPAELTWIRIQTNNGNTFKDKTIVISGTFNFNSRQWTPIGTESHPFEGEIEIIDCLLENFSCSTSGYGYYGNARAGLFGIVETNNVYISGLEVNDAIVNCSGYQIVKSGILFAELNVTEGGNLVIEDSSFTGKSCADRDSNGGLISKLTINSGAKANIRQVFINLEIGGQIRYMERMNVGGLICELSNNGIVNIFQCIIEGNMQGLGGQNTVNQTHPGTVGGILGPVTNNSGAIITVEQVALDFEAATSCGSDYAAFMGTIISKVNKNDGNIYISNTSNKIKYEKGHFNGFIGSGNVSNVNIINSYLVNTGNISSFFNYYNCPVYKNMELENIYFLNDKIKINTNLREDVWKDYATQFAENSRTQEELKTRETFKNWDFEKIWCMEKDGYPVLLNLMKDKTFYKINAQALSGGTIEESGITNIVEDGTITYHIYPNENYEVDSVIVDGTDIGNVDTYTFSNVKEQHTIVASFREKPIVHTITYELNEGELPANAPYQYEEGSETALENPSRTGYIFSGWYRNSDFSDEKITHITPDMKEDITIYAKWLQKVETPITNVESGIYQDNLSITLSSQTQGADIYYTTDGTDPRNSSTAKKYMNAIELYGDYHQQKEYTLFAYAVLDGMADSDIISYNYQIQLSQKIIDKIDITNIKEPKALNIPATSAECTTEGIYQISTFSWNPEDAVFQYNTLYTVSLTIQPEEAYRISDFPTVTLNGNDAEDILINDDGTITINYTFERTEKKTQEIPQNISSTTVSAEGIADGKIIGVTSDMEYKKGVDGIYQDCPNGKIDGLEAGEYYIRYKETNDYAASNELRIIISYKESPTYTLSLEDIIFQSQVYGYDSIDEQTITIISGGSSNATIKRIWVENNIFIIDDNNALPEVEAGKSNLTYKIKPEVGLAVGEYESSLWIEYDNNATTSCIIRFSVKKDVYSCPDSTQILTIPPTYQGSSDGQITGVSEQMEYKREGSGEYLPCTGSTITDLYAGKYYIRFKESENFEASQPIEVVIKDGKKRQPGKIETSIELTELLPNLQINDDVETLKDLILSDIEKELIQAGNDVRIYLDVKDISDIVNNKEKELIVNQMKGYTIGCYLDINMFKQFNDGEKKQITDIKEKISITVSIPEKFINKNSNIKREYGIVRVHNLQVESLPVQYDVTKQTLTFETDKFSTYAIVYKDSDISGNNNSSTNDTKDKNNTGDNKNLISEKNSVNTGDRNNFQLYLILLLISSGIIIKWLKGFRFIKK
jgi:uncharacterized repeat protein (TIGR02543 family)